MTYNSKELMEKIVQLLDDKKAQNIKVMEIKDVSLIADYFIICTGTSNTQIKAIADNLEDTLKKEDIIFLDKEGYDSAKWILMDYGNIVVHIFDKDSRNFYNLERLWSDAIYISTDYIIN